MAFNSVNILSTACWVRGQTSWIETTSFLLKTGASSGTARGGARTSSGGFSELIYGVCEEEGKEIDLAQRMPERKAPHVLYKKCDELSVEARALPERKSLP